MSIKTIDTELQDLRKQETELKTTQNEHAENGRFDLVATIKAQLEYIGTQISRLTQTRAEAVKQAEIDAQFAEYEQLSKEAKAHYTQLSAIDSELNELRERIAELTKERSDMEAEYHVPKHKKIRLFVDLNRIDRNRLNEINSRYTVEGYL